VKVVRPSRSLMYGMLSIYLAFSCVVGKLIDNLASDPTRTGYDVDEIKCACYRINFRREFHNNDHGQGKDSCATYALKCSEYDIDGVHHALAIDVSTSRT
jgi:hypothetical protein